MPMDKKVLLLGLGMQGKAALHDLASCEDISHIVVVDCRPDMQAELARYPSARVTGRQLDVGDETAIAALMKGADVVVEALPAPYALPIGRLAAASGTSLVSSMYYADPGEQDPGKHKLMKEEIAVVDRMAKEKGIIILTEFGLDPGLDLLMGAKAVGEMDAVHVFRTYGAGIPGPSASPNPLNYRFSWSVLGVIRSYRRPARIIAGGQVVEVAADRIFEEGNRHLLNLPELGGPLECFPNGDSAHYAELLGIRHAVTEMGRYTCRLPGHCAFWDVMVKSGFLDEQPVRVGEEWVRPLQFTATLLSSQEQFHYGEREQDMTFVRVEVQGTANGKPVRVAYQLIDYRDFETGFTSMQRTVGFTMSLGAQLILRGELSRPGLLTPLDVPFDHVIPALAGHGIRVTRVPPEDSALDH